MHHHRCIIEDGGKARMAALLHAFRCRCCEDDLRSEEGHMRLLTSVSASTGV